MYKIAVVTTTRAEYGLLKKTMNAIKNDSECELFLIVSGTHLIDTFGKTVNYIMEDGFNISEKIFINIDDTDAESICKTMAEYQIKFAKLFNDNKFDFLIVLGDRYELIPICSSAMIYKIPIAHISGGEITQGAMDDVVRHCVTKMSYLHFPACEEYRRRIIQLGESPNRVFNVGDPGVENIFSLNFLDKNSILQKLNLPNLDNYFVVLFHPITLENISSDEQINILLSTLAIFKDINFIFIKGNADVGGSKNNSILASFVNENNNFYLISSIRIEDFLSLQKNSLGLIGNSSSGIVETPCFKIPTINIGDRQKGRLFAKSIISVDLDKAQIEKAVLMAQSDEFRSTLTDVVNPYGLGDTSKQIVYHIKKELKNGINIKKAFYDMGVIK